MKLYTFDGVDHQLELVPLAARRALDRAGLKLSLEGWRSLPLDARVAITAAGSGLEVDVDTVIDAAQEASPEPNRIKPRDEPAAEAPPSAIVQAFGADRPISAAIWSALSPLDRYCLAKVGAKARGDRIVNAYNEIVGHTQSSTHIAPGGGVRMVDVSHKQPTKRRAVAESSVTMNQEALGRLVRHDVPKGDVLGTARIAGIMAAKRTSELVPLCHPLSLTQVGLELEVLEGTRTVRVVASVETLDRTGVEMEAMVAASVAALTVYDMLKAFDRRMEIGPTRLMAKSGGRSGDYKR